MVYIACERLVFLTPSIEKIMASKSLQQLCFSDIRQTRSYLKCCYISLNNFLIELLEITDFEKAHQLAFFKPDHNYTKTYCAAIGLCTDNLTKALQHLSSNQNIDATELYTSKDANYPKGYRHQTACLNVKWFDKMVYLSEYDDTFFQMRKTDIVTDIEKMRHYSIKQIGLDLNNFSPPDFIIFNDGIPELKVHPANEKPSSLECEWIVLSDLSGLADPK